MDTSKFCQNNFENLLLMSPVPDVCRDSPCILGIDEAGRGPVLGPMVYGIAYCPQQRSKDLKDLGVDDSKSLTETQREGLLTKLMDSSSFVGWAVKILSPYYISTSMYRRRKYNLNEMSHDTAISLIRTALTAGVQVSHIYVDTVGPPEKYEAKLQNLFPDIRVTVSKKADSLYPSVSAASICAKVARDRVLAAWKFPEIRSGQVTVSSEWGSGYPGDPATKSFLRANLNPLFGFPSLVRFSWKTAEHLLDEQGYSVEFEELEPEEDPELKKNPSIKKFFVMQPNAKSASTTNGSLHLRCPYFRKLNMDSVSAHSFLKRH